MRFTSHPDARCPRCRRQSVWFGLKQEASGWKVHCECGREQRCGHAWVAGRVSMSSVDSLDEAFRRGERLCSRG